MVVAKRRVLWTAATVLTVICLLEAASGQKSCVKYSTRATRLDNDNWCWKIDRCGNNGTYPAAWNYSTPCPTTGNATCEPLPAQYSTCDQWILVTNSTPVACPPLTCCNSPAGQYYNSSYCVPNNRTCVDYGPNDYVCSAAPSCPLGTIKTPSGCSGIPPIAPPRPPFPPRPPPSPPPSPRPPRPPPPRPSFPPLTPPWIAPLTPPLQPPRLPPSPRPPWPPWQPRSPFPPTPNWPPWQPPDPTGTFRPLQPAWPLAPQPPSPPPLPPAPVITFGNLNSPRPPPPGLLAPPSPPPRAPETPAAAPPVARPPPPPPPPPNVVLWQSPSLLAALSPPPPAPPLGISSSWPPPVATSPEGQPTTVLPAQPPAPGQPQSQPTPGSGSGSGAGSGNASGDASLSESSRGGTTSKAVAVTITVVIAVVAAAAVVLIILWACRRGNNRAQQESGPGPDMANGPDAMLYSGFDAGTAADYDLDSKYPPASLPTQMGPVDTLQRPVHDMEADSTSYASSSASRGHVAGSATQPFFPDPASQQPRHHPYYPPPHQARGSRPASMAGTTGGAAPPASFRPSSRGDTMAPPTRPGSRAPSAAAVSTGRGVAGGPQGVHGRLTQVQAMAGPSAGMRPGGAPRRTHSNPLYDGS